jgi:UDP-GlcNAc:undecaprenyl-phosphate/decaprenyl-phosphate GlcNAc-1-phosphate transferase
MDHILLSAALAFLITFFAIPVIIQVAKDKKLFDEPDERKVHKTVIPTLGGLGIFAGFIIATLMGVPSNTATELQYFAAAATVIFFLGIKDDILVLSASKKFVGQLIAAGIIIKFGGVRIIDMHGFLNMHEIPPVASTILTLFTVIVITNSFNLIDGVDGLAGSLGLLTTIVFGTYFFYAGGQYLIYGVMAFSLAGSILGFLIYNFSPAKIFMGDTGSLLLGLINSILVIKFINIAGSTTTNIPLEAAPAIGFAILMIPLFDTLRVFTTRILDRRSPFSPDRTHIHHFLLDMGLNHKWVTLTCVFTNMVFIAVAYFLRSMGTTTVIGILLLCAFSFIGVIYYYGRVKNRKALQNQNNNTNPSILQHRKVLSLVTDGLEVEAD